MHLKNEPSEDAQSPYTDFSEESGKEAKLGVPSSSPQAFSGIANYVPAQKPEWKRYKQYTRNDIMAAIEAVRNGQSALKAAERYGVPSRTLYDKVKKMGITTSRPFKRGANGRSVRFTYAAPPFGDNDAPDNSSSASAAFLEATTLLQHALDGAGDEKREALAAIAAAAAAAHVQHHRPPPSPHFRRSPDACPGDQGSDADDHVEDLSVQRHQVIVPNPDKMEAEAD